ncbi:GIY-YIG nuclease family protein [Nodosilinea sp. PGN35]|uniref:GIY-YIG nuclease family protein n=1 Tax=Nodosilinea sp. PGN35 TaxID=3020489 RepID=UPI0023B29292|nr:GIY-YIG nuclease family protein [Nodosilinea sp. TSF1-S3]MDF0367455.1 GIY-YIG nuclease family protein [Nodosilinea sp. TSF1-S3]
MKILSDLPSVPLNERGYLPAVSGVYIAATATQILYVGQSGDMRQRWRSHNQLDRLVGFEGVRLYYLLTPQGFCGQLESALIRQFAPLLNTSNGEVPLGDRPPSARAPKAVIQNANVELLRRYIDLLEGLLRDFDNRVRRVLFILAGDRQPPDDLLSVTTSLATERARLLLAEEGLEHHKLSQKQIEEFLASARSPS